MDKPFDEFRLMIVDPLQKLNIEESYFLFICFGISIENHPNEGMPKMVLTHTLKLSDESKTQLHPSSIAKTPAEQFYLKVCCIIMK